MQITLRLAFVLRVFRVLKVLGILGVAGFLSACASRPTQTLFQASGGQNKGQLWELATVQADFLKNGLILAVVEVDDQVLETPWLFGYDVVLLPPGGAHELKLRIGQWLPNAVRTGYHEDAVSWVAELGIIQLKEAVQLRGRNYLVASTDRIYSNNTKVTGYQQEWLISYPRTIDAEKVWSIQPLNPDARAINEDPNASASAALIDEPAN